jgi:broad specificity phosphatase PhoE
MTFRTGLSALDLVRHAESEGNLADARAHAAGALALELDQRDADVELSATGVRQAEALGAWMAAVPADRRPSVVLSSPYRRALSTAEAAVEGGGLDLRVRLDERLRERELGVFDGLTGRGIRERYPEEARRRERVGKLYYRPPGGESWCDVALRVRGVLAALAEEYPDQRVLVVTHQAVIMNFRFVLEELSERELLDIDAGEPLANCSITRYLRGPGGGLELEVFNDASTIAAMGAPVTEEPPKEEPDADAVAS